ncbi:MAG: L,D-transpeptidase [bacterium]
MFSKHSLKLLSLTFLSLIIVGLLVVNSFQHKLVPWATVGKLKAGNLTRQELESLTTEYLDTPLITIILPDQKYTTSLRDLGISVNIDLLWESRQSIFFSKLFPILSASLYSKAIPSIDKAVPDISYNSSSGELVLISSPQNYLIDPSLLLPEIIPQFGQDEITLEPSFTVVNRGEDSLINFNQALSRVFQGPLRLSLKNGSDFSDYYLDENILRKSILVRSTDLNSNLGIDKEKALPNLLASLTPKQKEYFNEEATYNNILTAVNNRFHNIAVDEVVLGVDDGPTSDGTLSDRYLEIDLSQQKMYFFINHALYKDYRISTGAEYPTPIGEYHIINKAPKAFSDIYNVWMPYWMGFKYASDIGAYLGIHELAYAVGDDGKPLYRLGYYIGDKKTGGCVAMEPKDSQEVYNLSMVDMLVNIVP